MSGTAAALAAALALVLFPLVAAKIAVPAETAEPSGADEDVPAPVPTEEPSASTPK